MTRREWMALRYWLRRRLATVPDGDREAEVLRAVQRQITKIAWRRIVSGRRASGGAA